MSMNRTTFRHLVAQAAIFLSPVAAWAANPSVPMPAGEGETLTLSGIVVLIIDIANTFITIAVTITVAMIIYAGFKMATAGDNTTKFQAGKSTLTSAIIGLVVILGVGIIVRTIGSFAVSPTSILR